MHKLIFFTDQKLRKEKRKFNDNYTYLVSDVKQHFFDVANTLKR